jgi:hypothetical protein
MKRDSQQWLTAWDLSAKAPPKKKTTPEPAKPLQRF